MPTTALISAERWIICACGGEHWGAAGAAGIALFRARATKSGVVSEILLQHRAGWTDDGNTWGIPGGALEHGETAQQGALREAREEAGICESNIRVFDTYVLDHGTWAYTTVMAFTSDMSDTTHADAESVALAWVNVDVVTDLNLHPAFRAAWTEQIAQSYVLEVLSPSK